MTPDKNSDEKMSTISLLGAEVVQTPSMAPYGDPKNFASVAKKLLEENPNAISLDQVKLIGCVLELESLLHSKIKENNVLFQYNNEVNPLTHYEYTAEEILSAVGELDMVVMGTGTGGTLAGVARKIKEQCPKCVVVAVDPQGSIMFDGGQPKLFFVSIPIYKNRTLLSSS